MISSLLLLTSQNVYGRIIVCLVLLYVVYLVEMSDWGSHVDGAGVGG